MMQMFCFKDEIVLTVSTHMQVEFGKVIVKEKTFLK